MMQAPGLHGSHCSQALSFRSSVGNVAIFRVQNGSAAAQRGQRQLKVSTIVFHALRWQSKGAANSHSSGCCSSAALQCQFKTVLASAARQDLQESIHETACEADVSRVKAWLLNIAIGSASQNVKDAYPMPSCSDCTLLPYARLATIPLDMQLTTTPCRLIVLSTESQRR